MLSGVGALCAAAALFLTSTNALGQPAGASGSAPREAGPDAARLLLEVDAEPSCLTTQRVAARIGARSSRVVVLEPGSSAPDAARASITQARSEETGSAEFGLRLVLDSGTSLTKRELRVRDCAEANDAAALIIVLWLDEVARAKSAGNAGAESSGAGSGAASPAAGNASSGAAQPSRGAADASRDAPDGDGSGEASPSDASDASNAAELAFSLGLLAHGSLGPAPEPLLGPAVLVTAGLETKSMLSPELRLTAAYDFALGDTQAAGGTASFRLASATLDLCPVRIGSRALEVRPCATGVLGALRAEGRDTVAPESATRFYSALGASLAGFVGIGSGLGISASVGGSFPLSRDRFQFAPVVFHEVPAVVGSASLGLSYEFP